MEISGEISQIKATHSGSTYLNMMQAGYGGIGVWCSTYLCPTYLLQKDTMVYLIQFEGEDWAKEWMDEYSERYDKIQRLS